MDFNIEHLERYFTSIFICGNALIEPGNPVIDMKIDSKGNRVITEMRSIEETLTAMALSGFLYVRI